MPILEGGGRQGAGLARGEAILEFIEGEEDTHAGETEGGGEWLKGEKPRRGEKPAAAGEKPAGAGEKPAAAERPVGGAEKPVGGGGLVEHAPAWTERVVGRAIAGRRFERQVERCGVVRGVVGGVVRGVVGGVVRGVVRVAVVPWARGWAGQGDWSRDNGRW